MRFKHDLIDLVIDDSGHSIFDYVSADGKKYKYTPMTVTAIDPTSGMKLFFWQLDGGKR